MAGRWTSPGDKVLTALKDGPKQRHELLALTELRTAALGVATKELIEDGKIRRTSDGGFRLA